MDYRAVGKSGVVVSSIGLGTLTWGRDTEKDEAAGQLLAFSEAGGTLLDTSPAFGNGASESLVGTLFDDGDFSRKDFYICTRVGFVSSPIGSSYSTSRGALRSSLEGSLERLRTNRVDFALCAGPDGVTPDRETALGLAHLVTSGLTDYIGVMGYPAWRVARMNTFLEESGLPSLSVIQSEYSLLQRYPEDEYFDACEGLGLGFFGTSVLGRGVLTGKYRHSIPATSRAASEHLASFVDPYLDKRCRTIVEAVAKAGDGLGLSEGEVALGWALSKPITSALIGARTAGQLVSILSKVQELPAIVTEALDDVS
ncbi:aldo/keto reductase [Actinotignum urinale]|uniref:aldo/keto reductase n=1 Tax=Actinotignum urinale TaxID=190146 RepID=UPI002A8229F5|nr:aldo/keto reductase [Actinotignum urinale]MDY5152001.1 aldo/keto reductase [Actinotignum urinale]